MDLPEFQQWEHYEFSFHDSPYFHLSYGSEFECEDLSLLVLDHTTTTTTEKLKKYTLGYGEQIYGDKIKPTEEMEKRIKDFKHHLANKKFYKLPLTNSSLLIQTKQLLPDNFNHAEVILTYAEPIATKAHNLCRYFFKRLKHSMKQLKRIWKNFGPPRRVLDPMFPYTELYKNGSIYILNSESIPLKQIFFTPQCTLGVEISKARALFDFLYQFYLFHCATNVHNVPIYHVYKECDTITEQVMELRQHWKVMKDYLFLFLVSYKTRTERKKFPFLFRTLFSTLWESYLGQLGRNILYRLLRKTTMDDELLDYFENVHGLKQCMQDPEELEYMEESTIIIHSGRFFIEFRGLYLVLEKLYQYMDLEETEISVENFLQHERNLSEFFCSPLPTNSKKKKGRIMKERDIFSSQQDRVSYMIMDMAGGQYSSEQDALKQVENMTIHKTEYQSIADMIKSAIIVEKTDHGFTVSFRRT